MKATKQENGQVLFTPENNEDWMRLAVAVQQGKTEYPFYKEHNVVPTMNVVLRQIGAPAGVYEEFVNAVFGVGTITPVILESAK